MKKAFAVLLGLALCSACVCAGVGYGVYTRHEAVLAARDGTQTLSELEREITALEEFVESSKKEHIKIAHDCTSETVSLGILVRKADAVQARLSKEYAHRDDDCIQRQLTVNRGPGTASAARRASTGSGPLTVNPFRKVSPTVVPILMAESPSSLWPQHYTFVYQYSRDAKCGPIAVLGTQFDQLAEDIQATGLRVNTYCDDADLRGKWITRDSLNLQGYTMSANQILKDNGLSISGNIKTDLRNGQNVLLSRLMAAEIHYRSWWCVTIITNLLAVFGAIALVIAMFARLTRPK